jgi:alkaline phosphatase D
LIDLITKEGLKNVIFFSGDRHKTELTKMTLENGNSIYDFTCSPLTSKAFDTNDEGNNLRVKGTHVSTQNFGIIELSGPLKERLFTIKTFDSEGALLWTEKISRQ